MKQDTPVTLPDGFGRALRDLRVSVTDRCNFRCPYCMPAHVYGEDYAFLPRPEILSFEEIQRLTRVFVGLGARKVRITGGEPLLRAELPRLIEELSAIDGVEDLTLTTNGYLLAARAASLKQAGLRRVTVSLDSLDPEVFHYLSGGRFDPSLVLDAIDTAASVGLTPIKINCVVQRGVNDHTLVELADRFRGSGHILRFIEFMDVGTLNDWNLKRVVTAAEIVEMIGERFPLEPLEANYEGEVASRYRYADGGGEIGIVASVSQPFCGGCTRVRLSTEGKLITCLFASGGLDLKTPLRSGASDEELRKIVIEAWSHRRDRYSEERSAHTEALGQAPERPRIQMYQIGG